MTFPIKLACYAQDRWIESKDGDVLLSAIDSVPVGTLPQAQAAAESMLHHARTAGGPALRRLTYAARGKLLRAMADAIIARKDELYELSYATGATKTDSWLDIEGGAGTLFVYASKAKGLPDNHTFFEGDREAITKGNFLGQHLLSPLRGAAVHINAYNFPVWGMLEKLGPAFLAGVPVIVKPATATSWLAYAAFRIFVESGLLPPGALQLIIGPTGDLFDHLTGQDIVSFTGSAATATKLRTHPTIIKESVRFSAEQDSLNASILGPDATPAAPEFDLFVKEVVREMTVKAGQKCTAIRRALVPNALIDDVQQAISKRLEKNVVGDPRIEGVRMGALAGRKQRDDVRENLKRLMGEARMVAGGGEPKPLNADASRGAFMNATLLRCDNPGTATLVHEVEAFGPVSTLMPYTDLADAITLAQRGKGSLVLSLFSFDRDVIGNVVEGCASSHGRMVIVDRESAADSTGHGSPLPYLVHGGPGRAGGGEELGGLIGMKHYMQRTAIQASPAVLDSLASR